VIMPHSTRRCVAGALAMLKNKTAGMPKRKHGNLPVWFFATRRLRHVILRGDLTCASLEG
jgi:hypothetical protein